VLQCSFARLFAKVPQPGDSKVTLRSSNSFRLIGQVEPRSPKNY